MRQPQRAVPAGGGPARVPYEGRFRNHMVTKGCNRDTDWFSVTDAEWPAYARRTSAGWTPRTSTPTGVSAPRSASSPVDPGLPVIGNPARRPRHRLGIGPDCGGVAAARGTRCRSCSPRTSPRRARTGDHRVPGLRQCAVACWAARCRSSRCDRTGRTGAGAPTSRRFSSHSTQPVPLGGTVGSMSARSACPTVVPPGAAPTVAVGEAEAEHQHENRAE